MLLRRIVCTAADRGGRRPGLKLEGSFLVRLPTHARGQEPTSARANESRPSHVPVGAKRRKVTCIQSARWG